jgi:hypothetical protein
MIRSASLALLLVASALPAAPVPKGVRAQATHVGKWQNVYVDTKDPATITSRGQFWYLGEDGSFTYQDASAVGPPPKVPERMVFDPKSGQMQHSRIAPDEMIRLGKYKIDGDRLTINLNAAPGKQRPIGLEQEPNSNIWHLQRIEEKK